MEPNFLTTSSSRARMLLKKEKEKKNNERRKEEGVFTNYYWYELQQGSEYRLTIKKLNSPQNSLMSNYTSRLIHGQDNLEVSATLENITLCYNRKLIHIETEKYKIKG